jgi:hypothetical protein
MTVFQRHRLRWPLSLRQYAGQSAVALRLPLRRQAQDGLLWRLSQDHLGACPAAPRYGPAGAQERLRSHRGQQVEKARINGSAGISFESVARAWFEARKATWKLEHASEVMRRLEAFAFPDLGSRPIGEIEPPELLAVLRKIERRPAIETAKKVSQACGQIFRFAIAEGKAVGDPSRDIAGALTSRPVTHRAFFRRTALAATRQDPAPLAGTTLHRPTPEVGAECVSSACSDTVLKVLQIARQGRAVMVCR